MLAIFKQIFMISFLFALIFICTAFETFAATLYVDYVNGVNTNNGTSPSNPWKHCPGDPSATGTAAAFTPTAGDTICLKGGVRYQSGNLISIKSSGTNGQPVVYDGNCSAFGNGTRADLYNNTTIDLNNRSYITIKNLEIHNWKGYAISKYDALNGVASYGNVINNNYIHDGSDSPKGAIYLTNNHNFTISDNTITYIDYPQVGSRGAAIMLHGFGNGQFEDYTRGGVVSGNYADYTGDTHYIFFGQSGITISNNVGMGHIYVQHSQGMTYYQNGPNGVIERNFLKMTHTGALTTCSNQVGNSPGLVIKNNIMDLVKNTDAGYAYAHWASCVPGVPSSGSYYLINNTIIRSSNQAVTLGGDTGVTWYTYNNIVDGQDIGGTHQCITKAGDTSGAGWVHETDISKIFKNTSFATMSDYQQLPTSPCKDVGKSASTHGITTDIIGTARPQGSGWDMGAYETIEGSIIGPSSPTGLNVIR